MVVETTALPMAMASKILMRVPLPLRKRDDTHSGFGEIRADIVHRAGHYHIGGCQGLHAPRRAAAHGPKRRAGISCRMSGNILSTK